MPAATAGPDAKKSGDGPGADDNPPAALVSSFDKVEEQKHPWGWIRWLMNSKIDPQAKMTFGIVHVNAGVRNPLHVHPNCEELLYVLSGSCEHRIGKQMVILKAGDTVRIPAGVPHMARTFEKQPLRAVIVYSSADRQFVLVEEGKKK